MMGGLLKLSALLLVLALLLVSGVNIWLREKSYVFSAEEVAAITNRALEETKGDLYQYPVITLLIIRAGLIC